MGKAYGKYVPIDQETCSSTSIDSNVCIPEHPSGRERHHLLLWAMTLHMILAIFSVGSLIANVRMNKEPCLLRTTLTKSPASKYVEYEVKLMNNTLDDINPFKSETPGLEQTEAWRELLAGSNILLTEDDLRAVGALSETSVKLEDGSGYLGGLDFYHELHCLNYIREYIHRDYYKAVESEPIQRKHVTHCIDMLRQTIMCHGDITVVSFDWVDDERFPYPEFLVERECKKWDKLQEYVRNNQANTREGNLLHPKFGQSNILPA